MIKKVWNKIKYFHLEQHIQRIIALQKLFELVFINKKPIMYADIFHVFDANNRHIYTFLVNEIEDDKDYIIDDMKRIANETTKLTIDCTHEYFDPYVIAHIYVNFKNGTISAVQS